MKKIAVISYGGLPLPPVKGGAVENLIQFFVQNNEEEKIAELTVFSIYDQAAEGESRKYKNTKFVYIGRHKALEPVTEFTNRIFRKLRFGAGFHVYPYLVDIVKIINRSDFDCVVVENRAEYTPYLRKKVKIPIYLHMHNDYLNSKYYLAKRVVDSCDGIIAVSDYVKKCVLTVEKDPSKVSLLRNVIDVSSFANVAPNARIELREKYAIKDTDTVFAFIGRITRGKGVAELVEAFSRVAANHANAKLLIVGSEWFSADKDGEFIKMLQARAAHIKDRIVFTGYVDYSRIAEQYACADVVVAPSLVDEACCLVAIEAMASGKALIVSDSGGIPEHVDSSSAIIIERGERFVDTLASTMESLILNPESIARIGESGKRRAIMYDKANYLKSLLDIIGN